MENKRKRYFVNAFHARLTVWALLLFGAGVLAIWSEVQGDLLALKNSILQYFKDSRLIEHIQSYSHLISQGVLLKAIFVMILIWFSVVYAFHHFFGPIYRLKICLKSMKDGDLSTRMKLRKRDYLTDVQDAFNEMAESIENRSKQSKS